MRVEKLELEGLRLITLNVYPDDRGFFLERYNEEAFRNADLPYHWVQDNFSRSKANVLRGLHYQFDNPQAKLVTCLRGAIVDVAVDIRQDSPTFGQHVAVELNCERPQFLYMPAGFAHGFCVTSKEDADVAYKVDAYYNKSGENGILFDDPELNIQWPTETPQTSSRDRELMSFAQYKEKPRF